jgi:polygalacturonase
MIYNVLNFGAIGNGSVSDTAAIQQAINACARDGAGTVLLPPGTYCCGSLELASNLILRLELGARLVASRKIEDFSRQESARYLQHYFIGGFNLENVIIEGDGTLDGSGDAFWEDTYFSGRSEAEIDHRHTVVYGEFRKPKPERPVTITLFKCRNVVIRNIRIVNSASYTVWPLGCDELRLDGLVIRNPRNGPNTDALDIDSCSNVTISNCDIDSGDDCIALKTNNERLGLLKPCERICITNCVLSSATCAIRIGYEGDAPIRDCVFSNLVIYDSKNGINILSIVPVCDFMDINHGTEIEQIVFSNIIMRNVARAFFIWSGNEEPRNSYSAHIRGLAFNNILIDAIDSSFIGCKNQTAIYDVMMRDIRLTMHKSSANTPQAFAIPHHWGGHSSDALNLVRINGISLDNVKVCVASADTISAGAAIAWSELENAFRDGVTIPPYGSSMS